MCHVSSEGGGGGAKATSRSRSAVSRVRPRWPRVCLAASATSRSRRFSRAFPAAVIRLVLRRRSSASVPRTTNPARSRPDIRRVRSESRVTMRAPIAVQESPPRPAARRIRRTLYCDGESPAAAVTAVDRSAASHAARTSAISTSSSSESRIAIAAAGVGTGMADNYSSRGVLSRARIQRQNGEPFGSPFESGRRDLNSTASMRGRCFFGTYVRPKTALAATRSYEPANIAANQELLLQRHRHAIAARSDPFVFARTSPDLRTDTGRGRGHHQLPEQSVLLVEGTGREEQGVRRPRAGAVPEGKGPQAVDRDRRSIGAVELAPLLQRAVALGTRQVERVDVAVAEVPDEQVSAELPEIGGGHGQSPRRGQPPS